MTNIRQNTLDANTIPLVTIGIVQEIHPQTKKEGDLKAGLIKVRLLRDGKTDDAELLDCAPLLPKFLNVLPKINEAVFIFTQSYRPQSEHAKLHTQRYWLGPLISQDIYLEEDHYLHSTAIKDDGQMNLDPPDDKPGAYGNPEDGDVILQGRYNTDIIQKNREIWLRAGKFEEGNNTIFNSRDVGYIQLKYGQSDLKRQLVDREVKTYIYETPEILINAQINIYDALTGTINDSIDSNAPQIFLDNPAMKTNVVVVVTDNKTSGQIYSFDSSPGDYNTEEEGLIKAKEIIDAYKGEKWKITSNSNKILDNYGRDSNNKISDTVLFQNEATIVTRIEKEVKFIPNTDERSSVLNMVANKINLISYDGEHTFNLTDPEKLIDEVTQMDINTRAHPLVYGDKLVEFLELVRGYVDNHVHNFGPVPADNGQEKKDVLNYDLNTILNHNINSN